ncbi:hypothetical protein BH09PSE6_BH09PSE6_30400 [soil metagenome]
MMVVGCGSGGGDGGTDNAIADAAASPAPAAATPAPAAAATPAPAPVTTSAPAPAPTSSAPGAPTVTASASITLAPLASGALKAVAATFSGADSVTSTIEWKFRDSSRANALPFSASTGMSRVYMNCRWRVRSIATNAKGSTEAVSAWSAPVIESDGSKTLLGVHTGNDLAGSQAVPGFDAWLGRPTDGVQFFGGYGDGTSNLTDSFANWKGSLGWITYSGGSNYTSLKNSKVFFWSIPLIPTHGSLADAANANDTAYMDIWTYHLNNMLKENRAEGPIYVRVGWEFNGDWFPWTAAGNASNYIAAFRRFATNARSISNRFVLEWNGTSGVQSVDPETVYPGDDYVDIISSDWYVKASDFSGNALNGFNWQKSQNKGLLWLVAFAAAHGKPYAIAEWGVAQNAAGSDPGAGIVDAFNDFFKAYPDCVYHSYWNNNAAFPGVLANKPSAAAAYKTNFKVV